MLRLIGSADAQTAAARLVRALNGAPVLPPLPPPATPWRDTLVPLKNRQLAAAALMTPAEVSAAVSASPLCLSAAGLAAASLMELRYSAVWAHDHLIGAADWDALPAALQAKLASSFRFPAGISPTLARETCLLLCRLGGPWWLLRRCVSCLRWRLASRPGRALPQLRRVLWLGEGS